MTGPERLRVAIDSEPVPRDLHALVRTNLDSRGIAFFRWKLVPLAIALFGCVGLLFAVSQAYLVSMLQMGLADHIHCALGDNYPKQTSGAEMASAVGPQFASILEPLQQNSGGLRLISAHECSLGGRQYVHFVLRGSDGLTSVSLLKRGPMDWLPIAQKRRLQGFSVFAFQDDDYLVFLSSANPKDELAANLPNILSLRI